MSQILLNMGQSLVVGSGISTFVKAEWQRGTNINEKGLSFHLEAFILKALSEGAFKPEPARY